MAFDGLKFRKTAKIGGFRDLGVIRFCPQKVAKMHILTSSASCGEIELPKGEAPTAPKQRTQKTKKLKQSKEDKNMMNTNLFSAIVVAMNELNDVEGAKLLSVINGLKNQQDIGSSKKEPEKKMSPEDRMEKILQGIADGEYPREKGLAELNEIKKSLGLSTPSTKSTPTKSKAKKFGPAKDVTVGMKVIKNIVTIDERQGRDTWTVLSRRFETLGGSYNKVDRTITFKTQKDAKAFAKDNVVTGSERDGIRKEWAEKA